MAAQTQSLSPNDAEQKSISAPEVMVDSLASQVNQNDIDTILQSQRLMLTRFEKTNEMLLNCNALAVARYSAAQQEFRKHTQQLVEMKKDLESVFRRIRTIKCKLSQQYSTAFQACSNVCNILEEGSEDTSPVQEPEQTTSSAETAKNINPQSSSCSQTTTPSPASSPSTSD